MKADQKLVVQRLSVLEPAEALGNVSEACRRAVSPAHPVLRVQEAFPDSWDRGTPGAASGAQVSPHDHPEGGPREDHGSELDSFVVVDLLRLHGHSNIEDGRS